MLVFAIVLFLDVQGRVEVAECQWGRAELRADWTDASSSTNRAPSGVRGFKMELTMKSTTSMHI